MATQTSVSRKKMTMNKSQKKRRNGTPEKPKEVPIQIMVPEAIRRQVAMMGADRGENIRTLVLRGLQAIGIEIPESELRDRRGHRLNYRRTGNGAK
ncbi:MAG: hypothetical protein NPINA01_32140 [Nitrospinaceae bacterium]|nr:MAG: hypothetical protein NPINA01_32140 [Nitrospinaceae bacterium]